MLSSAPLPACPAQPPISAFQLAGPDGLYTFTGLRCEVWPVPPRAPPPGLTRSQTCAAAAWEQRLHQPGRTAPTDSAPPRPAPPCSQPSVSYGTNAVKTTAKGYRVLDFADGGRIEVHFPTYYLRGQEGGARVAGGDTQKRIPRHCSSAMAFQQPGWGRQQGTAHCILCCAAALSHNPMVPLPHPLLTLPCRPALYIGPAGRADRHCRVHRCAEWAVGRGSLWKA